MLTLMPQLKDSHKEQKIVLIDDDPSFRTILLRAAHMKGVDVEVFESLEALGAVGLLSRYSVAIVDYELGAVNGLEIAEYLELLCTDTPMILVSATDLRSKAKNWPKSVKQFIPKSMGYGYIIEQAMRCAEEKQKEIQAKLKAKPVLNSKRVNQAF